MSNFTKDDLYVYNLLEKILASLQLLQFNESATIVDIDRSSSSEVVAPEVSANNLHGCSTCKVQFGPDLSQQDYKYHFKTDLHRLNLKRALGGLEPLSESEFDNLIETQSLESISGSEESDSESEEDHKLETVLEKLSTENNEDEAESTVSHMNTHSPFVFAKSPLLEETQAFGIYKALFSSQVLVEGKITDSLKECGAEPRKLGVSVLLMIGGGHFAGAVISHTPKNIKGNAPNHKESRQEQMVSVVSSKTFHRYTTRRKQGGSQSASDNARGKANSAGSSIRRYNEQALQKEVRELLVQWKEYLAKADHVFIRANGASNRKILVGYEGGPLKGDDTRIQNFPFTTKRATLSEVKKAWVKLMYLSVVDLPKAKEQKKKAEIKEKKSKTPEVEVLSESDKHTKEIVSLLKKSKAPLLINYIKKNSLSANFEFTPEFRYANFPTPLHYASSQGLHHMVKVLLVNIKADPTIENQFGKTPAQIASSQTVKNTFQVARSSLGEAYCDWQKAKVGPAKTSEDVAKEEEDAKKQLSEERKKLIEEELARKTELELKQPTISSGGTLSGENPMMKVPNLSGMTDQQKSRLMREQRARAAEARMKKLQAN